MKHTTRIYKKYYLNSHEFFSRDILDIRLIITHNCNYTCEYCYDLQKRHSTTYIDLNAVYAFITTQCNKHKKHILLTILGGEPTLHPDLYEFCKKVASLEYVLGICIYTNFTADNNYYLKFLNMLKLKFILSAHIQHMQFYKKLCNLLSVQNAKSLIGLVTITYNYKNTIDSIKLYQKIKKLFLNVGLAKLFQISAEAKHIAYNDTQLKALSFYNNTFEKNTKSMFFDHDEYVCEVDNNFSILSTDFDESNNYFIGWSCKAGIDTICIDVDGNIYPCQTLFYNNFCAIGNIKDKFSFNRQEILCNQKTCCNLDTEKFKLNNE